MPRKKRDKSALGIYHVMLRGINKQNIFFKEDDFMRMMTILKEIPYITDSATGVVSPDRCSIYMYCILNNHLHLLIHEEKQTISQIMQVIENRYAGYYNKKYQRIGHLFQGRFESEPVNDDSYLHTAFRYIARNSVKALESPTAEEYPYSGWNEYVGHKSNVMKVLRPEAMKFITDKFPLQELSDWINEDNSDRCLDMDDFFTVKSDAEAWDILSDSCHIDNPEDFRTLDPQTQIYYLLDAINHGINLSQAARLGTITRYQITKAHNKKHEKCGIKSATVSDPIAEESVEQNAVGVDIEGIDKSDGTGKDKNLEKIQDEVRHIQGYGKKTYHHLHLIVEYLYSHPEAKCSELSTFLNISNESARRYLVLLINENIVVMSGGNKNRVYALYKINDVVKTVE